MKNIEENLEEARQTLKDCGAYNAKTEEEKEAAIKKAVSQCEK